MDELGIKHEDDLDEELSVPDLCELLTGHGKRGQSDHPAELSIPRDTNGQNSESEPEGENPDTLTCMPPRDEKMITSLLSTITRLVSITNDLKTELHGLKTKFDNKMALSKDREQRLTNRLSVLENMLSNHGEMVQKEQRWDQIHRILFGSFQGGRFTYRRKGHGDPDHSPTTFFPNENSSTKSTHSDFFPTEMSWMRKVEDTKGRRYEVSEIRSLRDPKSA